MKRLLLTLVVFPLFAQNYSEKERVLGEQIAAEIRRHSKPLGSTAVEEYVGRVGRRIESHAGALSCRYEVVIADASEPMSLMGGHILIPASFFATVRDENEFAVMLSHAIAHIALNHGRQPQAIVNAAGVPLIYMGGSTGLHADPQRTRLIPRGYLETQRRHELEADRLGMDLALQAGYDPAALRRYLQKTQADARRRRLAAIDEFLSSVAPVEMSSASDFLQARHEIEGVLSERERRQETVPRLRRVR
jgi:metalloendopeptidase OMA1, mitochondrial